MSPFTIDAAAFQPMACYRDNDSRLELTLVAEDTGLPVDLSGYDFEFVVLGQGIEYDADIEDTDLANGVLTVLFPKEDTKTQDPQVISTIGNYGFSRIDGDGNRKYTLYGDFSMFETIVKS